MNCNRITFYHCTTQPTKALFLALYSSSCILPLSVFWSPPFPLTTTFMQMTLSFSSLSTHSTLAQAFLALKTLFNRSLPGWLLIFLLLTPLRLNSCSSDSKNQLAKIHSYSLDTSHSAQNLGFIYDERLTFSDQITALSKTCYYHIRQLRCIRPYLDWSTACSNATSTVHSKLDLVSIIPSPAAPEFSCSYCR